MSRLHSHLVAVCCNHRSLRPVTSVETVGM